ncbi:MAG TPA: tetratricopeptide repeat protein, partial [Phycisphaerales bacterium]|nr:tetratricopeptide repeat protein [Phycisphaerales bacterium]
GNHGNNHHDNHDDGHWGPPVDRDDWHGHGQWDHDGWRHDNWGRNDWRWRRNHWNTWGCNDVWWGWGSSVTFGFTFGASDFTFCNTWYYGRPWCAPRHYYSVCNPYWGTRWCGYSPGWYSSWRRCGFTVNYVYDPYWSGWYTPYYNCNTVYVHTYPTNYYADYDVFYPDQVSDEARWNESFGANDNNGDGSEAWLYGDVSSSSDAQQNVPTLNSAWDRLVDGNLEEARAQFTDIATTYPGDGVAHIGYGLSVALMGNGDAAVSAFREALRDDPEALRRVPTDDGVTGKVRAAISMFSKRANANERDADAMFMLGALEYLAGDNGKAYVAVDTALDNGDKDSSTQNLRNLIRNEMLHNPDKPNW